MAARRRVVWAERARRDLEEIVDFIADDSVSSAIELIGRIDDAARSLSTFGGRGRVVPERGDSSLRGLFVGSYRLVYRIETARIVVLAIVHGARRIS